MSPPKEELFWKRKLFPELVRLAWPIAVSMLSYSLMTVVDTLFVGTLGASALAGVAWGGVVAFTVLCFGIGLLRAVKVQSSQSIGAGRPSRAREALTAGLVLALGLGAGAIAVAHAVVGLVHAGAPSPAAAAFAGTYFLLRTWGAPVVLVGFALREARYALGDSRSPMVAALIANVAHIPLNALLIFHLGLGVRGAAMASLAMQTLEVGLLLGSQQRGALGRFSLARCRELIWLGWPLGVEFFLDVGAGSGLAAAISRMGEVELAAHQIAIQLSHFAFLPAIAVAEAASVLAAQAVGAGEDRLVSRVARAGLLLVVGYVALCGISLLLGGDAAARCFSPEVAVQTSATRLLHLSAAVTLLFSVYVLPRAVLRGIGSERYAAAVTVVAAWLFPMPAAVLLGLGLGWGAAGGWVGLAAELTLGAVFLWWRLASGAWQPGAARARASLEAVAKADVPEGLMVARPAVALALEGEMP